MNEWLPLPLSLNGTKWKGEERSGPPKATSGISLNGMRRNEASWSSQLQANPTFLQSTKKKLSFLFHSAMLMNGIKMYYNSNYSEKFAEFNKIMKLLIWMKKTLSYPPAHSTLFLSSIPFFENGWNWLKESKSWRALGGASQTAINEIDCGLFGAQRWERWRLGWGCCGWVGYGRLAANGSAQRSRPAPATQSILFQQSNSISTLSSILSFHSSIYWLKGRMKRRELRNLILFHCFVFSLICGLWAAAQPMLRKEKKTKTKAMEENKWSRKKKKGNGVSAAATSQIQEWTKNEWVIELALPVAAERTKWRGQELKWNVMEWKRAAQGLSAASQWNQRWIELRRSYGPEASNKPILFIQKKKSFLFHSRIVEWIKKIL